MRILHVVRQFHPSVGGLEGMVLGLASQQRAVGLDARVLTLDRLLRGPDAGRLTASDEISGVPVRRISCFGPARYPIATSIVKHLRPFDIVHVHGIDFFCDYLAATAPLHRKPLVLSTHGGFFHTEFARRLKKVYFHTVTRQSLRRYRRVLACSAPDFELFRPIAGKRLRLIENGVDIAKFAHASSPEFEPRFVYFGRFAAHKGLEQLIDAFARTAETLPEARLVIAGHDPEAVLPPLRQRASRLTHPGQISFLTGLSDDQLRRKLAECSFFVTASRYEGFGLALVEALSAGLLPIANRIPSAEAILSPGIGCLTDFSDPATAGRDMAMLVQESRLRHRELRQAAIAASRRFSWETVEGQFRSEYEALLGTRKRAILGVNLSPLGREQAIDRLESAVSRQEPLRVAFANANTLTIASRNAEFRQALGGFLVLNDGIGVDIASWMKFGRAFPDNLNGTDFVPEFLDRTRRRLRIFLLGGRPGIAQAAAQRFAKRWPQHDVVGTACGYFGGEQEIRQTCERICISRANLVLVALGNPLQELWIARHGEASGATLLIGVGALFDFTVDRVHRAPPWLRRARCEWMYRLASEPRRLAGRYLLGNALFLASVLRDRRRSPP